MAVFTNEVLGPLTDAELRATAVPISGSVAATVSGTVLVDGSAVTQPVSGTVTASVSNFPATQPVSGSVTVLNASIPVTGTFWQATQPVSGTFWQATQPVSGSVSVSNFPATQPVSGTVTVANPGLTDAQLRATPVVITGSVSTSGSSTGTATVSRVAVDNTAAVTLSASNSAKTRLVIYNEGGTLFVKYGATASNTDYTYVVKVDTTLEISGYYGLVTARKASGSTFVQVTEVGI
jgi:hypothetical protein